MTEKEFEIKIEQLIEKHSALVQEFYDSIPPIDGTSRSKKLEDDLMPSLCYFAEWLLVEHPKKLRKVNKEEVQ